jgi:hypothetical protein
MRAHIVLLLLLLLAAFETASADSAHDRLLSAPESARNERLAATMAWNAEYCSIITRSFYQGMDLRGFFYWNVECVEGSRYVVVLPGHLGVGGANVFRCKEAWRLVGLQCFKRY